MDKRKVWRLMGVSSLVSGTKIMTPPHRPTALRSTTPVQGFLMPLVNPHPDSPSDAALRAAGCFDRRSLERRSRGLSGQAYTEVRVWNSKTRQWQAVPTDRRIVALNDQHAHLRFDPASAPAAWPQVGERVMLGISHPCTTFDKWRWMPVVDAHSCVSSAIHTCF